MSLSGKSSTKINATFSVKSAKICLNRCLLCLFAVLLLWITTLRLCVDIANIYVKPPPLPQVIKVCEDMASTAETQRAHYSACVSNQMEVCQKHLDNAYNDEYTRVVNLSTQFKAQINNLVEIDTKMSMLLSQILQSQKQYIATLYDAASTAISYNDTLCSAYDVTLTQALLDDGTTEAQESMDRVETYTFTSNARVNHLSTHIR